MPMYFPDLKSVQRLAKDMAMHQEESKKYKGIYPETEKDLPEARKQLAKYLREVWNDNIFALEVELGVSEDNYNQKMGEAVIKDIFNKCSNHEIESPKDTIEMLGAWKKWRKKD